MYIVTLMIEPLPDVSRDEWIAMHDTFTISDSSPIMSFSGKMLTYKITEMDFTLIKIKHDPDWMTWKTL